MLMGSLSISFRINTGLFKAPVWFQKELRLIHPDLHAEWLNRARRWAIYQGRNINRIIHNEDDSYRPLDQRALRKLRMDYFFMENPKALERWENNEKYIMGYKF